MRRGEQAYAHLGTGNYNPTNGRLYTDFSLFTRDPQLTGDARAFFDALEAGTVPVLHAMRTRGGIRDLLLERIRGEAHPRGHVILKANHLTDPDLLAALEACAAAGGRVDVVVRTTVTRIAPAVHVRSIVGRFLEHARVVAFRRDGQWEVWAGSFDPMPRAFEKRYELAFPVKEERARRLVLQELRAQLRDDVNAYALSADGTEEARWGGAHDSQALGERHGAVAHLEHGGPPQPPAGPGAHHEPPPAHPSTAAG